MQYNQELQAGFVHEIILKEIESWVFISRVEQFVALHWSFRVWGRSALVRPKKWNRQQNNLKSWLTASDLIFESTLKIGDQCCHGSLYW